MNTKITLTEALQTIINKRAHHLNSDMVYITFDREQGFDAIAIDFELKCGPEYLYLGSLGEFRENWQKLKKILNRLDIINNQVIN